MELMAGDPGCLIPLLSLAQSVGGLGYLPPRTSVLLHVNLMNGISLLQGHVEDQSANVITAPWTPFEGSDDTV